MTNNKKKEKLLFTYIKRYDRHKYVEAVIHVQNYLNIVKSVLLSNKKEVVSEYLLSDKIKKLNEQLFRYKISFAIINTSDKGKGIVRGNCNKEIITILLNESVYEYLNDTVVYKDWLDDLAPLIGHELVHRGQFYVRKNDFLNFYAFEYNHEKTIEEMSATNTQEIMAYALMGIENMRYKGFSDDEILNKIQTKQITRLEDGIMNIYIHDMKEYNYDVYKKFVKYIYDYLKNPIKYDLQVLI